MQGALRNGLQALLGRNAWQRSFFAAMVTRACAWPQSGTQAPNALLQTETHHSMPKRSLTRTDLNGLSLDTTNAPSSERHWTGVPLSRPGRGLPWLPPASPPCHPVALPSRAAAARLGSRVSGPLDQAPSGCWSICCQKEAHHKQAVPHDNVYLVREGGEGRPGTADRVGG